MDESFNLVLSCVAGLLAYVTLYIAIDRITAKSDMDACVGAEGPPAFKPASTTSLPPPTREPSDGQKFGGPYRETQKPMQPKPVETWQSLARTCKDGRSQVYATLDVADALRDVAAAIKGNKSYVSPGKDRS